MIETRKLPVKLTPDEIERVVREHSDTCSTLVLLEVEKKAANKVFTMKMKPHKEHRDMLQLIKDTGVEQREVDCEHRESLVTGQTEVVRLDTFEVIETYVPGASVDDDEPDPNQPALPFAAPAVPVLRCTAVDIDGVCYAIQIEQAEVIERILTEAPNEPARILLEGSHRTIVAIRRGKACEFCGVVPDALGAGHRPECAGMKADDAEAEEAFAVLGTDLASLGTVERVSIEETGEDPADTYDRNDTAAVAAHIDSMTRPNDAPLTPVGEDTKPLVKLPKRGKKAATEGEAAS
jgi:hypothetical protein